MAAARNLHSTAVVVGNHGILIRGASGSGKSMFALHLIADAARRDDFAALVADDQVLVEACNGRLALHAPPATRGLAEMRGIGISAAPSLASAIADCVVDLVEAGSIARLPEPETMEIEGVKLPRIRLPQRDFVVAALMLRQFCAALSRNETDLAQAL